MSTASQHAGDLPARVLVADDEGLVARHIVGYLQQLNIEAVGPVANGALAVALARETHPDLALLDIQMPQMDGLSAASVLYEELGIPVVLISAYSDPTYIQRGAGLGVFGYLIKPVNADELRATLTIAWSRYRQHSALGREVGKLQTALEERKVIERAKGMLMDQERLGEAEAMRRLQQEARSTRRRLIDVARDVLESGELPSTGGNR